MNCIHGIDIDWECHECEDINDGGTEITPDQVEQFTTKTGERRAMMKLATFWDRYSSGLTTPEDLGITETEAKEICRKVLEAYPRLRSWMQKES